MKKVAIDIDSTLAATYHRVFEYLDGPQHGYTYDDLKYWDWPIDRWGEEHFFDAFRYVWSCQAASVPLYDCGGPLVTELLSDHPEFEVDIVTAQEDCTQMESGKRLWLYDNEFEYNNFVTVPLGKTKAELDYDIYVDDKPSLPERVTDGEVYLIDHRYNRDAPGEYTRVDTPSQAYMHMTQGMRA